ncbi:hypothetical protein [Thalassobacillus pellis]|uniref:hypothetical protein n=1 Tax=Thalassobacillus pellis TaxID=748008 RepID=UPI001960A82D|nr:hypothetical protein [Thalassobacillus pellis]MBM7553719.1 hypothetical protein [Thalassobacillus pellis]
MKKYIWMVAALTILSTTSYFIIKTQYLYTPISFEQDEVTSENWWDYKNTLSMEFHDLNGDNDYKIKDPDKIKRIIEGLKKASIIDEKQANASEAKAGLTLESNNEKLFEIIFYETHWKFLRYDSHLYQRSEQLESLLNI